MKMAEIYYNRIIGIIKNFIISISNVPDAGFTKHRINKEINKIQIFFKSNILKNNEELCKKINSLCEIPNCKYKLLSPAPRRIESNLFLINFRAFD